MRIDAILGCLKELRKKGENIVIAGVGSGITAKAASKGGADILATYNTAAYRIQGIPTGMAFLPYDDCNELAFKLAPEILAASGNTPVIIGLGAHDPRKSIDYLLSRAQSVGVTGVTNEPFIGIYEGDIKKQMDAAGIGFEREVSLLKEAVKRGLLTLGYAFNAEEATILAAAGVHIIGAMVGGVTSGGAAGGAETVTLDYAAKIINEIVEAASKENPHIPVLTHGGPLRDTDTVSYILNNTGASGYITGSTGERIPVEIAVKDTIASFKSLKKGCVL